MVKIILCVIFSIILASCSSLGTSLGENKYSAAYINSHVIKNKTTKSEIQSIYGVPDEQYTGSNSSSWTYRKSDRIRSFSSSISGYIPGADNVLNTIGIAQNNAEDLSKASKKVSGSVDHSGNALTFEFNSKDVVADWNLR
ncbi:hypothetical protein RMB13_00200 [Acinetobacter sp. V102_4]|uniref:hypothetical protein n=1 Tax=Acinetobacter sp. V102_4 TaxID=3072984 RepID=UPI00287C326F|nr:hypothetical protein [Acinetobacter sp. V102_4]MDS7927924.1 hypothetical protein [Acinetobacter sp. V102_4]